MNLSSTERLQQSLLDTPTPLSWRNTLTDDDLRLVTRCELEAIDPCGLPGQRLMLLVARLAARLDERDSR